MRRWLVVGILLLGVTACGGDGSSDSGVAETKRLGKLSNSEIASLCGYLIEVIGEPRAIDCGDSTVNVGGQNAAECEESFQSARDAAPDCTATVRNAEECFEDIAARTDEQICSGENDMPDSCLPLLSSTCN